MKSIMLASSYLLVFAGSIALWNEGYKYTSVVLGLIIFVFVYLMSNIKVKDFHIDLDDKSLSVNRQAQEKQDDSKAD